jgi:hypothetical protein
METHVETCSEKIKVFCEKMGMAREPNILYEILLCSVINHNSNRYSGLHKRYGYCTNIYGRYTKDNVTNPVHQAGLSIILKRDRVSRQLCTGI